ncbi:MAG: response regulator transcription factor, partial [Thermicanus sp.]|nr:response regulator transcription factor [Thermicanus sp.]
IVRDGLSLLLNDFFPIQSILFAEEGGEALRLAEKYPIDLALIDLSMPGGMDGFHAITRLRRINPKMKLVVFSMHDEDEYKRKAYLAGADGYIEKRLHGEEIVSNLREVLNGKKAFPAHILMEGNESFYDENCPLSSREKEIFVLTVLGYTQKEIAEQLTISTKTVENHRLNISKKLGTNRKRDWVQLAKKYHLVKL